MIFVTYRKVEKRKFEDGRWMHKAESRSGGVERIIE